MKAFLALAVTSFLLMYSLISQAQDNGLSGDTLTCGGFVNSESLEFKYNSASQMYSATTVDFNFWVYIKPMHENRVDVALTRSIEPNFRDKVVEFMNGIGLGDFSYIAKADTQTFTMGLTDQNYLHFYFEQGSRQISFSCLKKGTEL